MMMKFKKFDQPQRKASINVGDVYQVSIRDMGKQGDGIARVEGMVVFVRGAKVGEDLEVRITKVSGSNAFAEKVEPV
jgi:predicted RNA-binding protein with TRAM domain